MGPLNSNSLICSIFFHKNWQGEGGLLVQVGIIDGDESKYCIKFIKKSDEGQRFFIALNLYKFLGGAKQIGGTHFVN